jgi:hypothetical protein
MSDPDLFDAIRAILTPHSLLLLDAIGFIAGSLVAMSGIPKVLQRVRARRNATARFDEADLWRDGAQAAGNLLWVYVGFELGLISVTFFCALQAGLMTCLIALNLQARRETAPRWEAAPARQAIWPAEGRLPRY